MGAYDIMIAPLLSGSGMRVKIIEAMALGKVVITTKIGAEGINYKDRENIYIAETSADIINAIKTLSINKDEVKRIGNNARKLIESHYDNSKIMTDLINFYQSI